MHHKKNVCYVLANFGGPRHLDEIYPFLQALLTDKEVIRTPLPRFLHHLFFSWIAKRRTKKVRPEYQHMGGGSPIYKDTEAVAVELRKSINEPILTFHRYLPATHASFVEAIRNLECDEIRVFPMFPQFTYATTGSVARWFQDHLSKKQLKKIRWIKSYAAHPAFVHAHQMQIRDFLQKNGLREEESYILFSAHGVPQKFVDTGDIYEEECRASFAHIIEGFPKLLGSLCFQSRFGKAEWLKPYTITVSENIKNIHQGRPHIIFLPISFTSDHIETLCEIEKEYMSVIRTEGLQVYRIPSLNLYPEWLKAIQIIMREPNLCSNQMLLRR